MIELGHNLGLEVVAEGVETETVLDMLGELGCDWAQGYHLSRPQPGAALTSWLQSRPNVRCLGQKIVVIDDAPGAREMVRGDLAAPRPRRRGPGSRHPAC